MHDGEAPVFGQDQPASSTLDTLLANAGVPRSLSPELLTFARENDLRLEGEGDEGDEGPDGGTAEDGSQPNGGGSEEPSTTLDTFDESQIPDEVDRDWIVNRYKQMTADYTRKTQEVAAQASSSAEAQQAQEVLESLRNPTTAAQTMRLLGLDNPAVLQALGYDIEEPEEPEYIDPDDRIDQVEARLNQEQQLRQEAQKAAEDDETFMDQVEAIESEEDTEFSDEEVAFMLSHSKANRTPQGDPNVKGARALLKGIVDRRHEEWVESRKGPKKVGGGIPARDKADLSTSEGRRKHAAAVAEAVIAEGASS